MPSEKAWIHAGAVGMVCAVAVAAVSFGDAVVSAARSVDTGWAMTVAAGIAGFATTHCWGDRQQQIQQTTVDLKSRGYAKGNFNAQASIQKMNLVD